MFDTETINQIADALTVRMTEALAPASRRWLTVDGAAEQLGRTRRAVEHLIARGVIPVTRLDGKIQLDRLALDKVMESRSHYEC